MKRMSIVGVLIAATTWFGGATPDWTAQYATTEQAELAKALASARVSLQDGPTAAQREGSPISAKFEVDNGTFQLSVYTTKGGKFAEVIVNHQSGKIAKATPITGGDDLTAARAQLDAMTKSKKGLRAVVEATVDANGGYRAVSIIPALKGGRPVAEVTLAKGDQFKTVSANLD